MSEECFSRGYLKFAGQNQWVNYYTGYNYFDSSKWTEQKALRYTTPTGLQWTVIKPGRVVKGEKWLFADLVAVPESLEIGQYVLSMRWDCQNTPQIWSACANIEIV